MIEMNNGQVRLHQGDSRDVLRVLDDNSIDSIVCDPPYALVSIQKRFGKAGSAPAKHGTDGLYARASAGFMGKDWDVGETAFAETFWAECLRVLKPGGHVVAFGGTRTYHRLVCAIEDAGFEIRDQIGWVYGSGFPKSHNQKGDWEGWGTALKPAWEPICLARKPLAGTVAGNLQEWGVGALNVDGCRVDGAPEPTRFDPSKHQHDGWRMSSTGEETYAKAMGRAGEASSERRYTDTGSTNFAPLPGPRGGSPLGRWPANIIHDGSEEVLAAFPHTTSGTKSAHHVRTTSKTKNAYGERAAPPEDYPGDSGSAARFFYCAKASRKDRDEGLEGFEKKSVKPFEGGMSGLSDPRMSGEQARTARANTHPTVKPTSLMSYLCRLITPPGGTILDPFMGSGSTGKAAVLEGFNFVGIEREDEYMPIAEARIAWAVLRADGKVTDYEPPVPANDNTPSTPVDGDLFGTATP